MTAAIIYALLPSVRPCALYDTFLLRASHSRHIVITKRPQLEVDDVLNASPGYHVGQKETPDLRFYAALVK
jgi:hypothetical protein